VLGFGVPARVIAAVLPALVACDVPELVEVAPDAGRDAAVDAFVDVAAPLPGPSWSAFSSRDRSEATLPPPKREPIALVDPRTGIFDRFFLQAMVVGVLVLALFVVLLTAR
jgi:hypothetical protein